MLGRISSCTNDMLYCIRSILGSEISALHLLLFVGGLPIVGDCAWHILLITVKNLSPVQKKMIHRL